LGRYKLTETEEKFAELIWQNEPIGSGDLVKLSEKEMNWKKSTTYVFVNRKIPHILIEISPTYS
jgi:BlaI family penicillinase repressor